MTGVESRLFAAQALLAEGWADNVLFNIGTDGTILSATPDVSKNGLPTARGPVLPGMLRDVLEEENGQVPSADAYEPFQGFVSGCENMVKKQSA